MSKILIVEDDASLANSLKSAFIQQSWAVEVAGTGSDAWQLLENFSFDMIILDWKLPDVSGIEICRKFRASGAVTPIVFLTANDEMDFVEAGLDSGADDYITKPFEMRELMARIRSVQRRASGMALPDLVIGEVKLDPKQRRVFCGTNEVKLTSTESELLEFLMRNPGQTFASANLFKAVWPSETESSDNAVRVHILVLRRKLALAGQGDFIKTELGRGYFVEAKK